MFFSIIIPTCNRSELLRLCLDQLDSAVQEFDIKLYEVIVTDDSSDDQTMEMITRDFSWVAYSKGPRKGPASNRNNGARNAKGEWLVFLDDDCIPDSTLVNAYLGTIKKNPDIKVFEGKIYANRPQKRFDEIAPINLQGGCLWSCNFCIDKLTFDSIGGFDEDYPYASMEDMDFHKRLVKNGQVVLFESSASVCHPWRKRKGKDWFKKELESFRIYLKKHPEEKKRFNFLYRLRFIKNRLQFIVKKAIEFRLRGIQVYLQEFVFKLINIT